MPLAHIAFGFVTLRRTPVGLIFKPTQAHFLSRINVSYEAIDAVLALVLWPSRLCQRQATSLSLTSGGTVI